MVTVNGKLINQELNQLDEFIQRTEKINQRCEYLELQISTISRQNYTQDLQKIGQEVDSTKSHLQKLNQKICFLEEVTLRQAKQLLFLKISSVIGLVVLLFMSGMNHQPEYNKNQHRKHTDSIKFLNPCTNFCRIKGYLRIGKTGFMG